VTLTDRRGASRLRRPRYTCWYRTAAASSDETVRSSGSKTGHWPRWPSFMAASPGRETGHRLPRSRAAHRSGPRMIGGSPTTPCWSASPSAGRRMCWRPASWPARDEPRRCGARLRCAAGYMPPRGGPSRGGPRPPLAPTPETRCWVPSSGGTPPLADAVEADGATRRRARSAICRVAARLAADLLVHRRAAPGSRRSGCSTRRTGQDCGRRPATTCARTPTPRTPRRRHAHQRPGRRTVDAHPECLLHGHPKWRQQLVVEIETGTRYRATGRDR